MKTLSRYILIVGFFSTVLALLTGCSEEHVDTISFTTSSTGTSPFKIKTIYSCDHTNRMGKKHKHPEDCGFRNCPRLEPDGSFSPGIATGASCPDETSGGLGIRTELSAFNNNASSILENLKTGAISQLYSKVGSGVSTRVEASGKLNSLGKGRLSGELRRDLISSFNRKWDESAQNTFRTMLASQSSQLLSISATAGGTMGCGQKRNVGIDFNIKITVTLHASATVRGNISDDGAWDGEEINWITFALNMKMGVVGKGLQEDRIKTSCNCSPVEEGTATPKETEEGHLPRRCTPPLPDSPFIEKRTVLVKEDSLDRFQIKSAHVFVLEKENGPDGKVNKIELLVPAIASGGFAVFEIISNPNGRGSHCATDPTTLKALQGDTIAYTLPHSKSPYRIEGVDQEGIEVEREAHKLGTLLGQDIIILDNSDRAFEKLDRMGNGHREVDLSTITTELHVEPTQRVGSILKGTLTIQASPQAKRGYRFDAVLHAPGFMPARVPLENIEPNTPFPLESLHLVAVRPGTNNLSVEIKPIAK